MKDVVVETVKELLRVALLAVIPVAVDGLSTGEVNWRLILIAGAIAALRALDKFLHLWGKESEDKTLMRGLTQF